MEFLKKWWLMQACRKRFLLILPVQVIGILVRHQTQEQAKRQCHVIMTLAICVHVR
ncbi:UNVERIFIED_CONTAM: hypothetical protein GTU68_010655 [Idotea baltica]|nr:hypothetical protein [Idotea baltica]